MRNAYNYEAHALALESDLRRRILQIAHRGFKSGANNTVVFRLLYFKYFATRIRQINDSLSFLLFLVLNREG